ncbi:MAG: replication-relaxation family protein, partial [Gemmatimonadota bacterium]|nr:replication-relaxation family protein [Gemmatimonadota bacterium]
GALARTTGDRLAVRGWERPFRGLDPARDASGNRLPPVMEFASAARLRAAAGPPREYVLVADFGQLPIGFYRREVVSLLRYAARHDSAPVLVVGSDRPDTWETAVLRWAQEEGLAAGVPRLMVKREEVETGHLRNHEAALAALDEAAMRRGHPWRLHLSSGRVDRAPTPTSGQAPERVREGLPPSHRLGAQAIELLGLVGEHIWLTVEEAVDALRVEVTSACKARAQLLEAGYIRELRADEVVVESRLGERKLACDLPGYEPRSRLMEMTHVGLGVYAQLMGAPPLSERERYDGRRPQDLVYMFGLSGGGPEKRTFFGAREKLTLELAHTRGINWLGLAFHRAAPHAPIPVRVAAWHSPRGATRKDFRPDGFIRLRVGDPVRKAAYFLEYDRAEEREHHLVRKMNSWYEFVASGRARAEYGQFYPVLFVTTTAAQERLILSVAYEVARQVGEPLPILTTTISLITQACSLGVLAPIWRTLHGEERVSCLPRLPAASAPPGAHDPRYTSSSSSSCAAARATSLPTPDLQTRLAEVRAASATRPDALRTGLRDT